MLKEADTIEKKSKDSSANTNIKGGGTKRFHVSFPESLHQRLEEIMQQTHQSTVTDTLKDALKVYSLVADAHMAGKDIVLRDRKDGSIEVFRLFV